MAARRRLSAVDAIPIVDVLERRLGRRVGRAAWRTLVRLAGPAAGARREPRLGLRTAGLWGLGRRDEAIRSLTTVAASADADARLDAAGHLIRLGRAADAYRVLAGATASGVPPAGPARARSLALLAQAAEEVGRYREALDAARSALEVRPGDPALRDIVRRQERHLARFVPLRDRAGARVAGYRGRPGRSLLIVNDGLLLRQTGYTVRTQQVARAQLTAGLDPVVLVVAHRGRLRRSPAAGRRDGEPAEGAHRVDDVPYVVVAETVRSDADDPAAMRLIDDASTHLARVEPAVLHAATPFSNAYLAAVLRDRYGLPFVYEVRGFREETWLVKSGTGDTDADIYRLTRQADTEMMRSADAVVTLGEGMRREIVSRGVPAERVAIAPNMVDTARFVPGPRDAALAARLGIAGHEAVVGYISSFNAYEENDRIVHAVAALRRDGLPVRGLLVGDGFRRDSDEQLAERVAPGAVLFPGRVAHAEIPAYYRLIDVFVIPRSDDRISRLVTPLKPYEALAAGRAIVASRVDALAEILEEGVTAIFYDAGDTAGLTDAVRRLVTDGDARARLSTAAREQAVARHGLEGTGRRYRDLYERLGVA